MGAARAKNEHGARVDVETIAAGRDPAARKLGLLRIVDESGDDYLYPAAMFVPIAVPRAAARAFVSKSA